MNAVPTATLTRSAPDSRWRALVPLGVGCALLIVCALLVHEHHVAGWETSAFRAINDRTVLPFAVVWPVMQLGNFVVVPVAAALAGVARRWRLAVGLLLGGTAAYLIAADVVRRLVVRGRPPSLLADVQIRGAQAHGLGFVSGHVAVITALAVITLPYVSARWRPLVVAAPVLVALARMYVGAHLPLDVLGGAGLGLAVGGVTRLLLPPVTAASSRRRNLWSRK
jgi:membrane-associated phospholipid phosphatase